MPTKRLGRVNQELARGRPEDRELGQQKSWKWQHRVVHRSGQGQIRVGAARNDACTSGRGAKTCMQQGEESHEDNQQQCQVEGAVLLLEELTTSSSRPDGLLLVFE